MKVLISGFGSAGRRHYKNLAKLGIKASVADPLQLSEYIGYASFDEAVTAKPWDLVVVASPPAYHLEQISKSVESGAKVLCEKPLCDFGQEAEAKAITDTYKDQVMMAYNYRFHSAFATGKQVKLRPGYGMTSYQRRLNWPKWGFILDHLAHAVDMLEWQSGSELEVQEAIHKVSYTNRLPNFSIWTITGSLNNKPCIIKDHVYTRIYARRAFLMLPDRMFTVYRDLGMFDRMWSRCLDFTNGQAPYPNLEDALRTQLKLAQIYKLGGER